MNSDIVTLGKVRSGSTLSKQLMTNLELSNVKMKVDIKSAKSSERELQKES